MHPFLKILMASVFTLVTSSAIAHEFQIGDLEIGHPWTRVTPSGAKAGGGYLTLINNGSSTDRLLGGSSPVIGRVEIHKMEMTDGIMRMRPVPDGVTIPAGGTVELAPGGYHLMLLELSQPITEGDMIPVTLEFEQAGSVDIELLAGSLGSGGGGHN